MTQYMLPQQSILGAFGSGLVTGAKANVNGLASSAVGAVTFGIWDNVEIIPVTDLDRAYGYDTACAIAQASGDVLGLAMGGGAAKAAGKANKAGKQLSKHADDALSQCKQAKNGMKTGCFTEGTQVVVGAEYDADGVFVQYVTANIEDIKVGDLVYSYNTLTGETELRAVQSVLHRNANHLRYIEVIDENGVMQTLETTDAHPFWVADADTNGRYVIPEYVEEYDPVTGQTIILFHENTSGNGFGGYVSAGDLRVGDVCVGPNGELVTVISTRREAFPDGIAVYNFEVEGAHNYYVIANAEAFYNGASPVLVHNAVGEKCGADFSRFSDPETARRLGIKEDQLHEMKKTLKAKARANQKDCPALEKGLDKVGHNPDIVINKKTGDLGFQQRVEKGQRPQSVQIGVNIKDL